MGNFLNPYKQRFGSITVDETYNYVLKNEIECDLCVIADRDKKECYICNIPRNININDHYFRELRPLVKCDGSICMLDTVIGEIEIVNGGLNIDRFNSGSKQIKWIINTKECIVRNV